MKIDIGCGEEYIGDVNLDLFMYNSPHTVQIINPKYIPNFINGDAHNLPIRDNVFNIVYSSNVIEHLDNPLDALKEMNRISKNEIIVIVPNNPIIKEFDEHIYSWSIASFTNILNRVMNVKSVSLLNSGVGYRIKFIMKFAYKFPLALRRKTFRWLTSLYDFEIIGICQTSTMEKGEYLE